MFLYKHFVDPTVSNEAEDVIRNLRHVLGSRRGTGYFRSSFGLTGPGRRNGDEMLVLLMAEIAENIAQYEPRVELVGKIKELHDNKGQGARVVVTMRCRISRDIVRMTANVSKQKFDFEKLPPDAVKDNAQ